MTELFSAGIRIINAIANVLGGILLAPIGLIPGWLSLGLISVILGVLLLIVFKHSSNQQAIARIRDDVKANILAIKLFKDSTSVTFSSQLKLLVASFRLLFYSIIPMLIMIVPVSLILVQLGLWYQLQPLAPGEEGVLVKLELKDTTEPFPQVSLEAMPTVEITAGPVRVLAKNEVYWRINPLAETEQDLVFVVGDQTFSKSFAVGEGLIRLNPKRAGGDIIDRLLYPLEIPFATDSIVQSISIEYPQRSSKIYGANWWMLTFFAISMIAALAFKPWLNVRL
jgi:hypothetical protein